MSERPKTNWLWTVIGFLAVGAVLVLIRMA